VRNTRKTRASRPGLLAIVLLLACSAPAALHAHDPGLSALEVVVRRTHVEVTLSLASADARTLSVPEDPVRVSTDGVQLERTALRKTLDPQEGLRLAVRFEGALGRTLTVTSELPRHAPRGHRQLVSVRDEHGATLAERLLDASSNSVTADVAGVGGGNAGAHFFRLGIHHIATGYDHLLFLAAMILAVRAFGEAAAIVTAFSGAHAVALVVAALGLVHVPPAIVEPLIAASVIWVGLENVYRRTVARRWRPAFAFGLVHGMAFAGSLADLGQAEASGALALRLACFNAGIEAGQLACAALALPLLWYARRWPQVAARVQTAGSIGIALAGGYWLVERVSPLLA
jgi:hydrogenase/urease accessory protein HupE